MAMFIGVMLAQLIVMPFGFFVLWKLGFSEGEAGFGGFALWVGLVGYLANRDKNKELDNE
jgi:hypothetical protein